MDNLELTEVTLKQEIEQARAYATYTDSREPRAKSAYYNEKTRRIIIELRNGSSFRFSPELVEGLNEASTEALSEIEITPSGSGLHWESLDVDLSVPALMMRIFGTKNWMTKLLEFKLTEGDRYEEEITIKRRDLLPSTHSFARLRRRRGTLARYLKPRGKSPGWQKYKKWNKRKWRTRNLRLF